MFELPAELADQITGLAGAAERGGPGRLGATTRRMIDRYQADIPAVPGRPIVSDDQEALAYAVYRMPATYAAIRTVLDQLPDDAVRPHAHQLDIAGGTGSAVWAVADRWPGIGSQTVLEQSRAAIGIGRRLAAAGAGPVRRADWQQRVINSDVDLGTPDVITVGYLLSEIDQPLRNALISACLAAARDLVIIVEPGTTNGYRRILTARDQVIDAGWQILAPCPHRLACPLADQQRDWCHFSARLNRSAVHRRAKGAELGYEDEKFSYLVAAPRAGQPTAARVLRHPTFRKGLVELTVCQSSGRAERVAVAKRDQDHYRAARKIEWGDRWP